LISLKLPLGITLISPLFMVSLNSLYYGSWKYQDYKKKNAKYFFIVIEANYCYWIQKD